MQRPLRKNNRKRNRTSGFLTRMSTPTGRRVLKRRRTRGRKVLSVN